MIIISCNVTAQGVTKQELCGGVLCVNTRFTDPDFNVDAAIYFIYERGGLLLFLKEG
jgi:hypothetical protein